MLPSRLFVCSMNDEAANPPTPLAGRLDSLISRRQVDRRRVAERAGIPVSRVDEILRGETDADTEEIIRLAGALDVEPGELLGGPEG
jgi:transcriptional regulator with XRE-family HTH domain